MRVSDPTRLSTMAQNQDYDVRRLQVIAYTYVHSSACEAEHGDYGLLHSSSHSLAAMAPSLQGFHCYNGKGIPVDRASKTR